MKTSFALTALALALAPTVVVADFIPEGSAAHFFSTQSTPRYTSRIMNDALTKDSP